MFSHLKRRIGVLTAVAVLAALVPTLAVSTASAAVSATKQTATNPAGYSACPSGSAAAAGFTDTTSTDVDCIAMYGITTGVTATTYEPSASIPRWQMALYLTRFLSKASYTLGSGADQGFTDISGYAADIQTAINQLKQSGVTAGTTATTFSPDDNVTREQMAMFIERALGRLRQGPGGAQVANLINSGADTYNYTDIDTGVTFEGHNAIVELFQLGVTGETPAIGDTYRPTADITRAEMATFLTNAAAHTNMRPAGVSLQVDTASGFDNTSPDVQVTYRNADFTPAAGVLIDVFEWENNTAVDDNSAFTSAGACATATGLTGTGVTKCTIALGDMSTDQYGNLTAITEAVSNGKTMSYYAWTAATGTVYDNDVNGSDASTTNASSSTPSAQLRMSTDMNSNAKVTAESVDVQHGTTVTITAQMASAAAANVAESGNVVTFVHTVSSGAHLGAGGDTTVSTTTTTATTDANGTATFSFTQADPSTTVQNTDDRYHTVVASDASNTTTLTTVAATGKVGHFATAGSTLLVKFSDLAAAVTSTAVTQNATNGAAGSATAKVSRSATATVYDQYGNTNAGATVLFGAGASFQTTNVVAATDHWVTAAAHGLLTGDKIFSLAAGTAQANFAVGTVYDVTYVAATTFTLSADGGALIAIAADDAHANDWTWIKQHGSFGNTSRTASSAGTASVSWSDAQTGSFAETVTAQATGATAGSSTYYRTEALTAALGSAQTGMTAATWVETEAGNTAHADHVIATPAILDTANNTMVVSFAQGTQPAAGAASTAKYVSYTWDSNDYFFTAGATRTPATEAAFEAALALTAGKLYQVAGETAYDSNIAAWTSD